MLFLLLGDSCVKGGIPVNAVPLQADGDSGSHPFFGCLSVQVRAMCGHFHNSPTNAPDSAMFSVPSSKSSCPLRLKQAQLS